MMPYHMLESSRSCNYTLDERDDVDYDIDDYNIDHYDEEPEDNDCDVGRQ